MCALVTGVQTCALPISFRLDSLFDAGREVRRDALDSTRVGELMSTELVTVDGDVSLTDAIGLMERHGVKRLPVISTGKLVGLISRAAFLRDRKSVVEGKRWSVSVDLGCRRIIQQKKLTNTATHTNNTLQTK